MSNIILLFLVSVRWGFIYEQNIFEIFDVFKLYCIFLIILEIFLNLNVGYYETGRIIKERIQIIED